MNNELKHYKYVERIKTPTGFRYVYPEDLKKNNTTTNTKRIQTYQQYQNNKKIGNAVAKAMPSISKGIKSGADAAKNFADGYNTRKRFLDRYGNEISLKDKKHLSKRFINDSKNISDNDIRNTFKNKKQTKYDYLGQAAAYKVAADKQTAKNVRKATETAVKGINKGVDLLKTGTHGYVHAKNDAKKFKKDDTALEYARIEKNFADNMSSKAKDKKKYTNPAARNLARDNMIYSNASAKGYEDAYKERKDAKKISNRLKKAANSAGSAISTGASKASNTVTRLANSASKKVSSLANTAGKTISNGSSHVKKAISSGASYAVSAASGAANKGKSFVNNLFRKKKTTSGHTGGF